MAVRDLYDQPYLMLGRSGHPHPDFEGLPHIRLEPLDDEAARIALSHWSELVVPPVVAAALNMSCDGNPLILREVAASLTPSQLQGDIALPAVLPWTPVIEKGLSEVLDAVEREELLVLAWSSVDPLMGARGLGRRPRGAVPRRRLPGAGPPGLLAATSAARCPTGFCYRSVTDRRGPRTGPAPKPPTHPPNRPPGWRHEDAGLSVSLVRIQLIDKAGHVAVRKPGTFAAPPGA